MKKWLEGWLERVMAPKIAEMAAKQAEKHLLRVEYDYRREFIRQVLDELRKDP